LLSKNCIFDILNNQKSRGAKIQLLWIAFKKLYLWYSEQPNIVRLNNKVVVNCFQKIVSLIFWTTPVYTEPLSGELWIAFKKLYLWYSEQQEAWQSWSCKVVNCFQKIVSLIFWTTSLRMLCSTDKLWIAFKKLYLWYSEQRCLFITTDTVSCELLSKNCIFDILNNIFISIWRYCKVVNCFQKIVSLIFWTTHILCLFQASCCELLSKNCIFDILNNLWWCLVWSR